MVHNTFDREWLWAAINQVSLKHFLDHSSQAGLIVTNRIKCLWEYAIITTLPLIVTLLVATFMPVSTRSIAWHPWISSLLANRKIPYNVQIKARVHIKTRLFASFTYFVYFFFKEIGFAVATLWTCIWFHTRTKSL